MYFLHSNVKIKQDALREREMLNSMWPALQVLQTFVLLTIYCFNMFVFEAMLEDIKIKAIRLINF